MTIQRTTLKFPNDKAGRKALDEKVISFKANGWREIERRVDEGEKRLEGSGWGLSFFRKPENPDQKIIVQLERNMSIIDL